MELNVGKKVVFYFDLEDKRTLKGTIMEVIEREEERETNNYFMGEVTNDRNRYSSTVSTVFSNIVMLKTEQGIVTVRTSSIQRVDFKEKKFQTTATEKVKKPSVRVELKKPGPNKKIKLDWLAKGITWAPSYRIDLSDPGRAKLSAKALIINEVMDLENVQMELITGFPNIQFGEVKSPLALKEPLASFLNALTGDQTQTRYRGSRGRMVTQQAILSNVAVYDDFDAGPDYSSASAGNVAEDLFYYPAENITLKVGETAYLPLFTEELPYKHIYTWKIKDYLDEQNRYQDQSELADGKKAEEVWHSCRLKNVLEMPLTTGAAEFVKDGNFIGQDICYYTAPGAETTIRINRAMNVLAEQGEFEVGRQRDAKKIRGYHYDKVRMKGELKLRSRLNKTVKMEITKELSGEVLKTLPKAKDTKTAKGLRHVNPKHKLVWEIKLEAGKSMKAVYEYEVFVRN